MPTIIKVKITSEASVLTPGSLAVNINTPLITFFNDYLKSLNVSFPPLI